jgi:4-amino-4-deoxy-L-arabinose transferase-like glycosyltransferase
VLAPRAASPAFWLVLVFVILVTIVDPAREMLTRDDGWAYARSVRHLVQTGSYRLDHWAAANMPAQIGLAAAASHIFGYSLTLLRSITLALLLCGSLALYGLLRELGTEASPAMALGLVLMCSPMVLYFGFTFMTDVQFIGWVLLACLLYVKGLRRESARLLLLASVPAAMAVGTRQFGVALPAALVCASILARPTERPAWYAVLAGAALPTAAFAFQLWSAQTQPVFTQSVRIAEQLSYIGQPLHHMAVRMLARTSTIVQYVGLLLVGILPALLVIQYRRIRMARESSTDVWKTHPAVWLWVPFVVLGLLIRTDQEHLSVARTLSAALLPKIPWVLDMVLPADEHVRIKVTVLALAMATALFLSLVRSFTIRRLWANRTVSNLMLLSTAAGLLCLHLMYVQLNDTYTMVFVPFVLLLVGVILLPEVSDRRVVRTTVLGALIVGLLTAFWTRGELNREQAIWQASNDALATGVDKYDVRGSAAWIFYHSAFDDWLETLGPEAQPGKYVGWTLHRTFFAWLDKKSGYPQYIIWEPSGAATIDGYKIVWTVTYRDALMRTRHVHVYAKEATNQK